MKTATVSDLRNNFAAISRWILEGEAVTITKRGVAFAIPTPAGRRRTIPTIDRLARLRKMFSSGLAKDNIQEVIDYDRGNT